MKEYNPDLVRAWNDYSVKLGLMTPDEAMPLWQAFKAGWFERFKYDLMDKHDAKAE